jgi:hypothetical protein
MNYAAGPLADASAGLVSRAIVSPFVQRRLYREIPIVSTSHVGVRPRAVKVAQADDVLKFL